MNRVLLTSLVVCSSALGLLIGLGVLFQASGGSPTVTEAKAAMTPPDAGVPKDLGPPKVVQKLPAPAAAQTSDPNLLALQTLSKRLIPLHKALAPPRPGEWLAQHDESGQTFIQYLKENPIHGRGTRRVIYIQPLGTFKKADLEVLDITARFMGHFFCLPVKVLKRLPLSVIPKVAQRKHPSWGDHQLLAPYIYDRLLRPRLPADAATMLGLTTSDLWPGRGWNFVFGMASLYDRVGVWSTYRNGDPVKERALHLLRTIKIASHETGHMFSIRHCTAYDCGMRGSNSRPETDRHPLAFGPQCLAKLLWATGCEPKARYRNLAALLDEAGLKKQAERYRELLAAL